MNTTASKMHEALASLAAAEILRQATGSKELRQEKELPEDPKAPQPPKAPRVVCLLLLLALPLLPAPARAEWSLDMAPGTLTHHLGHAEGTQDYQPGAVGFLTWRPEPGSRWGISAVGLYIRDSLRRECTMAGAAVSHELLHAGGFRAEIGAAAGYVDKHEYSGPGALPFLGLFYDLGGGWFCGVRSGYIPEVAGCGAVAFAFPVVGLRF